MSAWQLRAAGVADASAMSALVEPLIARWLVPDGNQQATVTLQHIHQPDVIARNLDEGFCYWLAESMACELLGFIALKPPAHLYNLYVREGWHGQGVGYSLWQQLRQIVLTSGAVSITVNASESAVPVYRHWKFVETGPLQCLDGLRFQPMCWQRT